MRRGRLFAIRGTVVDPSGKPANSMVDLTRENDVAGWAIRTDRVLPGPRAADAPFVFRGLTPGTYAIYNANGQNSDGSLTNADLSGRVEVIITDSDVSGVVLALTPFLELHGKVSMEDGSPLPKKPGIRRVRLNQIEMTGIGSRPAIIDNDGNFSVSLPLGVYRVDIADGTLPHVKSIRLGNRDFTDLPLVLTSPPTGPLEIVISKKVAFLTVRTASKALVLAWRKGIPSNDPYRGIEASISGPDGQTFITPPPGDYYVAAFEESDRTRLNSPDLLALFEDQASTLHLTTGARESIDLKLIPHDKILAEAAKLP